MFFPLSKVIFFAITPSNLFMLAGLAGLVLLLSTTWRRVGGWLSGFGLVGLLAGGLSPLSAWMLLPLEERFPPFLDAGAPVAGIIVLGGGVEARLSSVRGQVILNDAGERPVYFADLARRHPQARLLFAGGSGSRADGSIAGGALDSRHLGLAHAPRGGLLPGGRLQRRRVPG